TRTFTALGIDPRPAISRGELLILPATTEIAGERGRPVPLALSEPKGGRGFDEPTRLVNRLLGGESSTMQFKPVRGGYIGQRALTHCPKHVTVPIQVQT